MSDRIMRDIIDPVVAGLRAEGHEYRGFLYAGLMLTCDGPKVIEFNVRFGDPEAQVVIPMIADDLAPRLAAAADGALDPAPVAFRSERHVGVVLAARGYPGPRDQRLRDRGARRGVEARRRARVSCRHGASKRALSSPPVAAY